ncbi:hypothetical protein GCK32_014867 [Trichostrongylus colubriformis]|uniref:Uncharacterized protein n=1 Tax=Trichostrongylus colubriformis TaxID=6319 RepID=A0AAN8EU12_TRICO
MRCLEARFPCRNHERLTVSWLNNSFHVTRSHKAVPILCAPTPAATSSKPMPSTDHGGFLVMGSVCKTLFPAML